MKDRRDFLKTALTGAVLLGSSGAAEKLAFADVPTGAGHKDRLTRHLEPGNRESSLPRCLASQLRRPTRRDPGLGSSRPRHLRLHRHDKAVEA